jgi:hypothetical protein
MLRQLPHEPVGGKGQALNRFHRLGIDASGAARKETLWAVRVSAQELRSRENAALIDLHLRPRARTHLDPKLGAHVQHVGVPGFQHESAGGLGDMHDRSPSLQICSHGRQEFEGGGASDEDFVHRPTGPRLQSIVENTRIWTTKMSRSGGIQQYTA